MQRGMKTCTTARAAVTACVLFIGGFCALALLGAVPALGLSTGALLCGPALLMIIGLTAGFIPMGLCLAALLIAFTLTSPAILTGLAALYLVPVTAVYVYCLLRERPFFETCGLLAVTLLLSQFIIYLLLRAMAGGQIDIAAGNLAAKAIYDTPYRDSLLYAFVSAGFLEIPAAMRDTAIVEVAGGYAFSEEVVNELLLQVNSYARQLVQGLLPSQLISGSGLNALMGLALGIRYGRRSAQKRAFRREEAVQDIPDLAMPPLREWHLPRPWGLRIGLLGLGYFLAQYSRNEALSTLGTMMFQLFTLCYGIQGLAAMNYAQHKRGSSSLWRSLVVVLALLLRFVQIALILVGVVDQISNSRGLRPPMRPRNEEE